jgi:hypothetical protein
MIMRVGIALALFVAAFFIVRAIVELLTLNYSDPSSYANDWGGPTLAGVLLVHCGLGVVAAIASAHPIAPSVGSIASRGATGHGLRRA